MSSIIKDLPTIQRFMTEYGMSTYLTLGNFGLILNMIIFSQSIHRRNSCSIYILATSFTSLIGLNSAIIPLLYSLNNRNPATSSTFICQLFYYLRHTFSQMMRTFIVFICIDRYTMCTEHVEFRRFFNNWKPTIRIVPLVILFWLLMGLFPASLQTVSNNVCDVFDSVPSILFSIYLIIVLGILPLVGMIIFATLIMINLRRVRARIQPMHMQSNAPVKTKILRKRDRELIRMILIEIFFYIVTALPITVALFYKSILPTLKRTPERQQFDTFFFYLTRTFLLYVNNSLSFWIYLFSSRSFRFELKHLLLRWCRYLLTIQCF